MASILRVGSRWQAQLCVKGVRCSKVFDTRRAAQAWAASEVQAIEDRLQGNTPDVPLSSLLDRYAREVSPSKRGCAKELVRLNALKRDPLAKVSIRKLFKTELSAWRDRRLRTVLPGSVLRDWNLLHHLFGVAVKEWGLLTENPLDGVRKPRAPLPRDRTISASEIDSMLYGFGYSRDAVTLETVTARVGAAFLFAIETGMRAGEICSLHWSHVKGAVAALPMTKNGFPRSVPLSSEALRLLGQLPRLEGACFGISVSQVESHFRKARLRALVDDLHFHDTRHEAITRLARRLDVLDLARMVGIRDLRILMVYYNAKPSDIAARLG